NIAAKSSVGSLTVLRPWFVVTKNLLGADLEVGPYDPDRIGLRASFQILYPAGVMCRPSSTSSSFLGLPSAPSIWGTMSTNVRCGCVAQYCLTSALAPLICSIQGNRRMLGLIEMNTICVCGSAACTLRSNAAKSSAICCGVW